MKLSGNTILITGGATGIGYALAEEFLARGNTVLLCGRREDRLKEAQQKHPELIIKVCDVTKEKDREALFVWATIEHPDLNVLVNNAGIQRDIDLTKGMEDLTGESEISINLIAPIHLSARFIPFLHNQTNAAIINVSSGLALRPESASRMPIYTATKAGLHAFSISLRGQLKDSGFEVIELLPPAVISELNPEGRRKRGAQFRGLDAKAYAASVFESLANGDTEIRAQ